MGKYFETSTNGVNTSSKIMSNITSGHVKTEPGSIKVPNDISTPNIFGQPTTYVAPSNGRSKIVETNPKFQEMATNNLSSFGKAPDTPDGLTRTPHNIDPGMEARKVPSNRGMTFIDEDGNEHTIEGRAVRMPQPSTRGSSGMTYIDEDGNEHTIEGRAVGMPKITPKGPDGFKRDEDGKFHSFYEYSDKDGNKYYYVQDGWNGHWEDADGNIIEDPSDLSGEESTNTDNQDNDAQSPSNEESNNEKERTPDSNDQNYSKNTASKTSTQINNTSVRKGTNSVIIKLDAGELNTRKTELKTATNELIKAWNDIKSNQIPAIEQSWIGTDSKAYTNKVTAQDPKLQAAFQALELLTNTFDKASNELQQTQSEVVKGINQS